MPPCCSGPVSFDVSHSAMTHFDEPTKLMCLACGALTERTPEPIFPCTECSAEIDTPKLLRLYEYSAEVYYYGRQYRMYYELAYANSKNPAKPSLGFAGEAFAWVMLTVLSGVIGNAAYDTIKVIVARIRDEVAAGRLPARDYSRLLELSDDELGELVDAARQYCGGMEGLTKDIRSAIVEEILADAISHDPHVAGEMAKLMQKKQIKDKHRKRFAGLLRGAMVRSKERTQPKPGAFSGLWSRVKR